MIPKIIHYCWFGRNPLPPLAEKCIASWREFLPDYEIKEWNEDNFDVNIIPYTADAYNAKKYAFVSDYARFWILYKYGGLYFDTDVEVIKSMDDIVERGPFMGCERYADNSPSFQTFFTSTMHPSYELKNVSCSSHLVPLSKTSFKSSDKSFASINLISIIGLYIPSSPFSVLR